MNPEPLPVNLDEVKGVLIDSLNTTVTVASTGPRFKTGRLTLVTEDKLWVDERPYPFEEVLYLKVFAAGLLLVHTADHEWVELPLDEGTEGMEVGEDNPREEVG